MVIWSVLGCLLIVAVIVVISRMGGASLGPYSTRLLAIGVACAGYYGAVTWLRFGHVAPRVPHWRFLIYVVPSVAGLGAIYLLWRAAANWRAEVHGFVKSLLTLLLVLVLAALAWLSLTH